MLKKFTTNEFIKKANSIHGEKYDYSKVEYKQSKIKIIIICKKHGEFLQEPNSHIRGSGCPICGNIQTSNKNKSNTIEFIVKSKLIHGNKYDYSKVNYKNCNTKIIIICPLHGEFKQTPFHHLLGHECWKCRNIEISNKLTYSTEEFIEKSKKIHNNKYDYSKVKYNYIFQKITIICPVHGDFLQTPAHHLAKHGCIKCGRIEQKNKLLLTVNGFINKAKLIHNNKYDYSKIDYQNISTKIKIVCKKHGDFLQTPDNHLHGSGCPKCAFELKTSKGEQEWLIFINFTGKRFYQINNYIVDGYDSNTNTIYEFLGDYWHGNPKKFNPYDTNKFTGKTFMELYMLTFERFKQLKSLGYNIKYIWENDWNKFKKGIDPFPIVYEYNLF